jgi:hypothetical protein
MTTTHEPHDLLEYFRCVPNCTAHERRTLSALRWAHGRPLSIGSYDVVRMLLSEPRQPAVAHDRTWPLPHVVAWHVRMMARVAGKHPADLQAEIVSQAFGLPTSNPR